MPSNILHFHYQIVKVLGLGRSGITYLAQDIDQIDPPLYIVKEIQFTVDNSEPNPALIRSMFDAQASIAHRVGQHPQIPSIVAKFEEDGHRYLVREYIEGELLSQELVPGVIWSQTQVFDFLMDLAGILCFVHSFNYIHQDINPHNIIRRYDDGRFNLIGFSTVKDLGATHPHNLTNHLANCSDSSYVPYEQEHNAPQFNSDIYAVGAIAIQALTGKFPLIRDADSYEFQWQDGLKIDARLHKIIDRMVRPDYRNRYQSGLEVLADLQSFALTQVPVDKTKQFNPYLIFTGIVCSLLLGTGIVRLLPPNSTRSPLLTPTVAANKVTKPIVQPDPKWLTYTDKQIKLRYAKNWRKDELFNIITGEQVTFTSPKQNPVDKYQENVSVRIEKLTNPKITLPKYTQAAIAEINKYYPGAKITESSAITLANKPAQLIVFAGKDAGMSIKNLEVWTIDRGKAYIITYKATSDRYYQYLETAMRMINSFKLK